MRVHRLQNERYVDAYVHDCDRFDGAVVMVRTGTTHSVCTDLRFIKGSPTGVRNRDKIISAIVQPFIARPGNRHSFKRDIARCMHTFSWVEYH